MLDRGLTHTPAPLSRWSVRTFLAWLVLACLLPGVIGAATLFIYQYRENHAQLEKSTIQTARALVLAVDHHLLKVQTLAQTLATDDALARHDFAGFHRRARQAMALAGLGTNIVLRDQGGRQIVNTAVDFGRPLPAPPAPEQVRGVFETGRPTISDVFIGPVLKRPIMSVDVPVVIDGKVAYALGAGVLSEHFNAILKVQGLPPDWIAGVVDRTGTLFGRTHFPERFIGQKARPELLQRMGVSPEGSVKVTTQEGIPVLSFYSRSPVTGWGVVIGIPRQALQEALGRTLALLALGVIALFCAGLVLAWYMGGRIARSVSSLTAPALALGNGDSAPTPRVHVEEAAEVAAAISRAADLLKERDAVIRARNDELAEAHRLARFGTWHWNLKTGEVTASESLREIFGRELPPFQEQRGTLLTTESWDRVNAASREVARTGGYDLVLQANHANGTTLWVRAKCVPVRDANGEIVALRGALLDITDRKEAEVKVQRLNADLERRVEQRTAELEQSNEALLHSNMELKHFAYATAHDLQTPLRSIAGFAQLLRQEVREAGNERVEEYSSLVIDNTKRLQVLIDSLLTYTRLDTQGLPFEPVDLGTVAEEVIASLAVLIQETGAEVRCGPLPTLDLDRIQIAQVLQNLVENGIKYNQSANPRVTIGCEFQHDRWLFSVTDNGVGIEPKFHEHIFEVFRRLHSYHQVAGSGIGLALCRRIVERHGGRIWVESGLGEGSTFYFTLPVRKARS